MPHFSISDRRWPAPQGPKHHMKAMKYHVCVQSIWYSAREIIMMEKRAAENKMLLFILDYT